MLDVKDDELDLNEQEREERRSLLAELNKNLFKQEAVAKQKARQNWLKKGDLNMKFFHSLVKWRRAKNEIHGVLENGQCWKDKDKVKDKVRDFFGARFIGNEELLVKLDNVALTLFPGRIIRCWSVLFQKRKLRKQCGAVIVRKALAQMDLIWVL